MDYFAYGSATTVIDEATAGELLDGMLAKLGQMRRVLLIPPDVSRLDSWSGPITCLLFQKLSRVADVQILPAVGTHSAMTDAQMDQMYPGIPHTRFHVHDWRNAVVPLGKVPGEFVREVTGGKLDFDIEIAVARMLVEGQWDGVFSIGQLVPHEVIGIANHNKNIFVGVGGVDCIHKTHFISGVFGVERTMGRAQTPVRAIFDYAQKNLSSKLPPISYVQIVRGPDASGEPVTRGLYAGDDKQCFLVGSKLAQECNITFVDRPVKKMIAYLKPEEFKSTWIGNKAVYRTRLALAEGAELIVLAPGVREFGEDSRIDEQMRKFGYIGTDKILAAAKTDAGLQQNLSAAAHLIHGSSDGRFHITYATPLLTKEQIESVNYKYGDYETLRKRYDPETLLNGWNTLPDGEEIYFVRNPAQGLWAYRPRFEELG